MSRRLLFATIAAFLLGSTLLISQDRRAIMSLVGHTDSSGNLFVVSGTGGTAAATGAIANLVGKTDASGNLFVALSGSSSMTGTMTSTIDNIAQVSTNALRLQNTTPAISGTSSYSPAFSWLGSGWKTNATAGSQHMEMTADVEQSGNGTVNALPCLVIKAGIADATPAQVAALCASGTGAAIGNFTVLNGQLGWQAKTIMVSTTDGEWHLFNNGGSSGLQLQFTGVPSVTSCGTGTMTTGSKDTSGEFTATGATACTVNFALTWTNRPFCVISNFTANRGNISAISTTAFTVSNLTANDVVQYHCIGRM